MREEYAETVAGPGGFEGESPIVPFIVDRDLFDEQSGNVEAPTGWFGRAGRWAIVCDSVGFWHAFKYQTLAEAVAWFEETEREYAAWDNEES